MEANENITPRVIELFMRGKKNQHFTCFYPVILFQNA